MTKRVLMISTVPSMIGQFNMNNLHILLDMGYKVDVAADFRDNSVWPAERVLQFKKEMCDLGIDCFQIDFSRKPLGLKNHIKSFKEIERLIQERQYFFIHTHTPIASAIVRLVAKRTKTKVIYTAHGFHFYKGAPLKNWILYYAIEKKLSRNTDILITINREDYERAIKKFHATEIKYIPGVGIDLSKIDSIKANPNTVKESLGIHPNDIMILSVGELSYRKNHSAVIEALNRIRAEKESIDNVHYFICGKGALEKRLLNESRDKGVNLHLLGYRNDIIELCKGSDLFIFPSIQEGLPVALMEAIACKTLVMCSNIRGNVDLIKDREYLFDPQNVNEIKDMLIPIISGPYGQCLKKERSSIIEENYKNIQQCDISLVSREMRTVYSIIIQ